MDIAQDAPDTVILAEDEASLYLQATQQRAWAPQGQTPTVCVDMGRANHPPLWRAEPAQRPRGRHEQSGDDGGGHDLVLAVDIAHVSRPAHARLQVMYFPPGCPDLNPQEHVWKDARGAVSRTHAFTKLESLLDAFMTHLRTKRFACSLLPNMNFEALAGFAKALRI